LAVDGDWIVSHQELQSIAKGEISTRLQKILEQPIGSLIKEVAQIVRYGGDLQEEIKADSKARREAIAPAQAYVPAIEISDGWDLCLGAACHDNTSIWAFRTDLSFGGSAKQAVKQLVYSWDLPVVVGTQSGSIFICSTEQMSHLQAVARSQQLAEKKQEIGKEIAGVQKLIEDFPPLERLRPKDVALAQQKAYNDLVNEGGDGYLPPLYTIDGYEYFVGRLAELQEQASAL
jgi:hypothetical protein